MRATLARVTGAEPPGPRSARSATASRCCAAATAASRRSARWPRRSAAATVTRPSPRWARATDSITWTEDLSGAGRRRVARARGCGLRPDDRGRPRRGRDYRAAAARRHFACCARTATARSASRNGLRTSSRGCARTWTASSRARSATPACRCSRPATTTSCACTTATPASSCRARTASCARCSTPAAPRSSSRHRRLGDVEPLFATTVHKSQGSEFDVAALLLAGAGLAAALARAALHRGHPRSPHARARRQRGVGA